MASGLTPLDASLAPRADPLPRADARMGTTPVGDGGGATAPQRGNDAPPKKRDKAWAKNQGFRTPGHPVGLAKGVGPGSEARTMTPEPWGWPEKWGCAPGEGQRLLNPGMIPWTSQRGMPWPRQQTGALRSWRASGNWPQPPCSAATPRGSESPIFIPEAMGSSGMCVGGCGVRIPTPPELYTEGSRAAPAS